jgi:hypothetical protein
MKKFYWFTTDFKRSMIEVTPNISYHDIEPYMSPECKIKLPDDVVFKVAKGEKAYDSARHYQGIQKFYSQKFIDILSEFYDVSNVCYPLNIQDFDFLYYTFFNIKSVKCMNYDYYSSVGEVEPCMFVQENNICDNLFCFEDSYMVIISEEAKAALEKAKITNICFYEVYGCTLAEKDEWEKDHKDIPKITELITYDDILAWKEKYKDRLQKWINPEIYFSK